MPPERSASPFEKDVKMETVVGAAYGVVPLLQMHAGAKTCITAEIREFRSVTKDRKKRNTNG